MNEHMKKHKKINSHEMCRQSRSLQFLLGGGENQSLVSFNAVFHSHWLFFSATLFYMFYDI